MKKHSPPLPPDDAGDKSRRIVMAVLAQVPFDGWTQAAWEQGLRQSGINADEAGILLTRGLYDVIEHFGAMADDAMRLRIDKNSRFHDLRTQEKIAFGVRARLEFLTPYREAMRRLMIWYAMPFHWPAGAKRLYRTVDLIWRAAGDISTDFNFYTKRGLLAGVLKSTMLYWLDDETPGCQESWDFLGRRIDDVMHVGKTISKLKNARPA